MDNLFAGDDGNGFSKKVEIMKFKWIIKFKKYEIPVIGIIIFLIAAIWALGMILAPLTLPPNSVNDLSGTVGPVENTDIFEDMNSYARFYYQAGDVNCHTKVERSYFINGNQMPFCARDVGIFFGMAFGLGFVLFKRYEIKLWWIFAGLAPMGVDWVLNSYLDIYHSNITRVATGGLTGFVITIALGWVVYDVSKTIEIKKEEKRRAGDFSGEPEVPMESIDPFIETHEDLDEPHQDALEAEKPKDPEI
jgi:uncharacterized membrane protein